jgi:hypothetical protein
MIVDLEPKRALVESRRPLSVASVASVHRVNMQSKIEVAERLDGHTRTTCRYPGPWFRWHRADDPPRPHPPSRMALYQAKAKEVAGQSVGETRR